MTADTSTSLSPDGMIDVRGLKCPLPVLKARKRLKSMNNNEILKVITTDPAAVIDFPHFCNEAGHELLKVVKGDDDIVFVIRKSHA